MKDHNACLMGSNICVENEQRSSLLLRKSLLPAKNFYLRALNEICVPSLPFTFLAINILTPLLFKMDYSSLKFNKSRMISRTDKKTVYILQEQSDMGLNVCKFKASSAYIHSIQIKLCLSSLNCQITCDHLITFN